jgi:hypothetical protein
MNSSHCQREQQRLSGKRHPHSLHAALPTLKVRNTILALNVSPAGDVSANLASNRAFLCCSKTQTEAERPARNVKLPSVYLSAQTESSVFQMKSNM